MARPVKYGMSTKRATYRVPATLDLFIRARATALGVSRTEGLILMLLDMQAEGPAALRSVQHKAEAEGFRRQRDAMARDINNLADRERAARKKAKDLAYSYRVLASTVQPRSEKVRESIRARLAQLGSGEVDGVSRRQVGAEQRHALAGSLMGSNIDRAADAAAVGNVSHAAGSGTLPRKPIGSDGAEGSPP